MPHAFFKPQSKDCGSDIFVYNIPMLTREDIAFMYLEQLPFEPYPFQEEAPEK
jgi:hypothetical protein